MIVSKSYFNCFVLYVMQCHLLKAMVSNFKLKNVEVLKTYDIQGKVFMLVYVHTLQNMTIIMVIDTQASYYT